MNSFWLTLLEINLILGIVYLGYLMFLRNLTFFNWIRFYLLGGILLGLLYPFLKSQKVLFPAKGSVMIVVPNVQANPTSYDYQAWAIYPVLAVGFLLFVLFLIRFFSLGNIHYNSTKDEFQGQAYQNTAKNIKPFSFWKWIYIHQPAHSDTEMSQIISHEQVHVRQRHSLDILLAEVCLVVCWYNPLVWFLNRAVRNNLEYLVDSVLIESGINKTSYQYSLLDISLRRIPQRAYGNHFAFKTLKQRIKMMNTSPSSKSRLFGLVLLCLFVFPGACFVSFSCQEKKSAEEPLKIEEKSETKQEIALIEKEIQMEESTAETETVKGKATLGKPEKGLQKESKSTNSKHVYTIPDSSSMFQDWKSTANDDSKHLEIVAINDNPQEKVKVKLSKPDNPLIFLDGQEVSDFDMDSIDPKEIESVNVVKDKSKIEKYGDKAKDGVIFIKTKK